MCEFCTQHGDGKKWYLQAENYAVDLSRDLERREYVVDFISGFEERMRRNVPLLKAVQSAPRPIRAAFRSLTGPRQVRDHFGQPVPIEDCERIFDIATSIVQVPCVCRHFAKTPEKGYCLGVTVLPADDVFAEAFRDFAAGPDTSAFQRLTREQAVALLRRTETEGLMHSVWTFKTPFVAGICNCDLASGCMAMKSTLELNYQTMWKGEYLAAVDDASCVGCSACIERCPFNALSLSNGGARVDADACYGCGICRSACGFDAIALQSRTGTPQGDLAVERAGGR